MSALRPLLPEPTYLVLGGSGIIGSALRSHPRAEEMVFTFYQTPIQGGLRFSPIDQGLDELPISWARCTHAFILFANSKPDSCRENPVASRAINVDCLSRHLTYLLGKGVVPVFISTEFVFDGQRGLYREEDEPNPVLLYGNQKLEAENLIRAFPDRTLVLRLAKTFGDRPDDGTFFNQWLQAIEAPARPIRCAIDQAFSPLSANDVADLLVKASQAQLRGLFHLSGNRRYTRMELLEILLREVSTLGVPLPSIIPCKMADISLPEPRPLDVSLICDRLITQCPNWSPRPIPEACRDIVKTWQSRVYQEA